jgi:type I restriction enzyme S subunit
MNTKQLRQKILDLAIHGKLVKQNPNDEPASVLLERVRAEKERLIKEGKIKRDKKDSDIIHGADKPPYEKVGNDTICIDNKIYFEIPNSWTWARMGTIGDWGAGTTPLRTKPEYYGGQILWLKTGELNNGYIYDSEEKITNLALKECSLRLNKIGDILIAMYGATIGKLAIVGNELTTNQACCACTPCNEVYNLFLFYYLLASKYTLIELGSGGAQPNISREKLINFYMPIPPLAEQRRIVSAIESAFAVIDEIEQNKTDLQAAVSATKQKILFLAIRGKLVKQDPNDEPVSVLLERIRSEREKLIDEGKIKRGKGDSAIIRSCDSPYYKNLPGGWAVCRLGDVCEIARGGSPRPIQDYITEDSNGINWIKIGDTAQGNKYITEAHEKIRPEGVNHSRFVRAGDFLLTNSMSFGRPYILKIDGCIHDGWLVINDVQKVFTPDFLYHLLSSDWAYQSLSVVAYGSTVKNLKSDTVKAFTVPIPPFAEQYRIVAVIEAAFEQLDNIAAALM